MTTHRDLRSYALATIVAASASAAPAAADAAEPIDAPADLAIHYGITTADPIRPGGKYDFDLYVTNNGPSPVDLATVVVEVPPMLVVPSPTETCAFANQLLICTFPDLGAGQKVGFSSQAQLAEGYRGDGSDIVRTVTVASTTPDPDLSNNSVTAVGPRVGATS